MWISEIMPIMTLKMKKLTWESENLSLVLLEEAHCQRHDALISYAMLGIFISPWIKR